MPRTRLYCCLLLLFVAAGCGRHASGVAGVGSSPLVSPTFAALGQGKNTKFHSLLPGVPIEWTNLSGPTEGFISPTGSYFAPLTMQARHTVTLQAGSGPATTLVHVLLELGPVERADCYAPGQPVLEDSFGQYVYVEELPEPIIRVPPVYPDLAREAGVDGTVSVQALVCACGEVFDVRVVHSIPMLDDAAKDAVRQWIFKPALSAGEPVAVWVGIPVRFALH